MSKIKVETGAPSNSIEYWVKKAADFLGLPPEDVARFNRPERQVLVNIPLLTDRGKLVQFEGFRVIHSTLCGPSNGALRFHPDADLDTTKELAAVLSWKSALLDLPMGGASGMIKADPKLLSKNELERLTREFSKTVFQLVLPHNDSTYYEDGYEDISNWIFQEYQHFRGEKVDEIANSLTIENNFREARFEATGQSIYRSVLRVAEANGLELRKMTVAIQGFGNVGQQTALLLHKAGIKVVAVSDESGGFLDWNGLAVEDLAIYHSLNNYSLQRYPYNTQITNEELLKLPVDILIPAATHHVITMDNAAAIRAKSIIEGANAPITHQAEKYLSEKGTWVLPDILANSGGVAVSFLNWYQKENQVCWTLDQIRHRANGIFLQAFDRVAELVEEFDTDWRTASYIAALSKINAERAAKDLTFALQERSE